MIIGLTGKMGSGKSTVAGYLMKNHGFIRHRMAEPLKQMIKCLGLNHDHVDGDLKEVPNDILGGKTPRWAMQSLGTEWGRDLIHNDLWINAWKSTLPDGNIVVDDIRFLNEVETIQDEGGYIINIHGRQNESLTINHSSETADLPYDFVLDNSHSMIETFKNVDSIIKLLG